MWQTFEQTVWSMLTPNQFVKRLVKSAVYKVHQNSISERFSDFKTLSSERWLLVNSP